MKAKTISLSLIFTVVFSSLGDARIFPEGTAWIRVKTAGQDSKN